MKQGFRCIYCKRLFGKRGTRLAATIEHLVAKADGGTNRQDNLAAACRHCNQHRGRQKQMTRLKKGQTFTAVPLALTISIEPLSPITS